MNRKFWIAMLSLAGVALVGAGFLLARPLTVANASGYAAGDAVGLNQGATTGAYYWSYAAKFVCGYQSPTLAGGAIPGEPVVQPGNYATEINIQNPNYKPILQVIKRVTVLVDGDLVRTEPQTTGSSGGAAIDLGNVMSTMDACNNLWLMTHPASTNVPTPMPLFIGYLVILSPLDINVNAVYTSTAPGLVGQPPASNSIHVQPVTGKRIFLPTGTNP